MNSVFSCGVITATSIKYSHLAQDSRCPLHPCQHHKVHARQSSLANFENQLSLKTPLFRKKSGCRRVSLKTDRGYPRDAEVTLFTISNPGHSLRLNTHWSAPPVSESALARSGGPRKMCQSPVSRNSNIERRMDRPKSVRLFHLALGNEDDRVSRAKMLID